MSRKGPATKTYAGPGTRQRQRPSRGGTREVSQGSQSKKCQSQSVETRSAWNQGRKHSKTAKQHVFIPREQLDLFFAVALYFAGPVYCVVLWLALVTSRRISETLFLRGTDICLQGGPEHDSPHVLYQKRQEDNQLRGQGKLGSDRVVARIADSAVQGLENLADEGLQWHCQDILEPFRLSHPDLFQNMKPLRKDNFKLDTSSENFLFPSKSARTKCRPNMARQTVWEGLTRIREVMWSLTHARRWNTTAACRGNRVTVHGATRHTSSALLLFNKNSTANKPTENTILEIQQRSDARTWRQHYCHADPEEVTEALEFGAAPSPFKKRKQETEHVVVSEKNEKKCSLLEADAPPNSCDVDVNAMGVVEADVPSSNSNADVNASAVVGGPPVKNNGPSSSTSRATVGGPLAALSVAPSPGPDNKAMSSSNAKPFCSRNANTSGTARACSEHVHEGQY